MVVEDLLTILDLYNFGLMWGCLLWIVFMIIVCVLIAVATLVSFAA